MDGHNSIPIRRTQRHDVAMRGRFVVAGGHADFVRLTRTSGSREGWLDADVVDLSGGGFGFLSAVYFPKRLLMNCELFDPRGNDVLLTCSGRVTRVVMTDRRPMYLVGMLFEDMSPEHRAKLAEVLASWAESEDAA